MKKILVSFIAIAALTGCAHDYYSGNVRYVQDGDDCIYTLAEDGGNSSRYSKTYNESKRVVYRNTSCASLYAKDTANCPKQDIRKSVTSDCGMASGCNAAPVNVNAAPYVMPKCNKCTSNPAARQYVEYNDEASYVYVKKQETTAPTVERREYVIVPTTQYYVY